MDEALEATTITLDEPILSATTPGSGTESPAVPAAAPPAAPAAPPSDSPEAAMQDLRRQLSEKTEGERLAREHATRETGARLEAERRAQTASHTESQSRVAAEQAQYDAVVHALSGAQQESSSLKAQLTAAMTAGEFDKVADLSEKIGLVTADVRQYERGKAAMDEQRKAPTAPQLSPEQQREQWLASMSPVRAAWLRKNDRFFSDRSFQAKVRAADGYALNVKGIPIDSPEYFEFIEREVGLRQDAPPPPAPAAAPPPAPAAASAAAVTTDRQSHQAPRAPAPAAPPANTAPTSNANGVNGNQVTLSAEERATARILFTKTKPDDPEPEVVYARNKAALIREGRWKPVN